MPRGVRDVREGYEQVDRGEDARYHEQDGGESDRRGGQGRGRGGQGNGDERAAAAHERERRSAQVVRLHPEELRNPADGPRPGSRGAPPGEGDLVWREVRYVPAEARLDIGAGKPF